MRKIKGTQIEILSQFTNSFPMEANDSLRAMNRQYENITKWNLWNIFDSNKKPLYAFDVSGKVLHTNLSKIELDTLLAGALLLENEEFRNTYYKLNAKHFYILKYRNYIEMEDSSFDTLSKIKALNVSGVEVIENDNLVSNYIFDGDTFDTKNINSVGVCQLMVNEALVNVYLRRFAHSYDSCNLDYEIVSTIDTDSKNIINDIFKALEA